MQTTTNPTPQSLGKSALMRVFFALICAAGCTGEEAAKRGPAPSESPSAVEAPAIVPSVPEPTEPKPPDLAATPAIELASNYRRLHLYKDGALVVPFTHDAAHMYSQEYRRPFGEVVEHDGIEGRRLKRRAVILRLPWESDAKAFASVWVWGTKGQRIELKINGKRAGVQSTPLGWSRVDFEIVAGALKAGENEIQIHARQAPIVHSLTLGATPSTVTKPPSSDARSMVNDAIALSGFDRLAFWTEVPKDAWMVFSASAESQTPGSVRIATPTGSTTIQAFEAEPNPKQFHIDLSDYANQLVRIELHGSDVVWEQASVRLSHAPSRPKKKFDNAILVVVDALRSDHLKLYGETPVESPNFEREGKARGAVFLRSQAASPSSPPSHGSIQTGQIARVHGVAGDKGNLKPGAFLLSSHLRDAGFATAYVGNNPFGMRRLKSAGKWQEYIEPNRKGLGIDCTAVVDQTLKFVEAQTKAKQRFFVSALPFEPHTPYRFHEGISTKYHSGTWGPPVKKHVDGYLLNDLAAGRKVLNAEQWSQLKALYAGEVEHMDGCFGTLVQGLKDLGVDSNTAIILTSDHGEAMFERGKMGHAYGLYSELMDVPIVVFAEGLGPKTISEPTGVIDIVPTIIDLLGMSPVSKIQGKSAVAAVLRDGAWAPQVVSSEYGRAFTLRSRDWRLLVNYDGSEELFHTAIDPTEQTDLANRSDFELRYFREMTGLFLEYRSDWHAESWGPWNNHLSGFGR